MTNKSGINWLTTYSALEIPPDKLKLTIGNSMIQAIISGNQKKVRRLLAREINLNSNNDLGIGVLVGALHVEDDTKRRRLFRLLLDHGAPYQIKDERYQRTVLHWACLLGRHEQVRVFLEENGGDLNLHDRDAAGYTALHYAVFTGSIPIVETLIQYHNRFGVSVDVEDDLGLTPYLHARRLGHRDMANLLYKKGQASVGHGDFLFRTPREWSQIGKFERRRASDILAADRINAAKIWGITNVGKDGEMLQVTLTSNPRRTYQNRTCVSLPALGEAMNADVINTFLNTERIVKKGHENLNTPPLNQTFTAKSKCQSKILKNPSIASNSNIAGFSSSSNDNNEYFSNSDLSKASVKQFSLMSITNKSSHSTYAVDENHKSYLAHTPYTLHHAAANLSQMASILPHVARANHNAPALSLLEQTKPVRDRVANHFHPSQFDKSKEKEYRTMLGNLTMIMDMLSEQQTKSFRKSVHVTQKETQRLTKDKKKVSTFAILFSSERSGRRRKSFVRRSSVYGRKSRNCDEIGSARREEVTSSSTNGKRERSSLKLNKSARKISQLQESYMAKANEENLNKISEEDIMPVSTIKIN